MRKPSLFLGACLAVAVMGSLAPARHNSAKERKKGKLFYLTLSAGFHHDVVPFSAGIVKQIGEKSGAFESTVTGDVSPFTEEGLKPYDAVMFYTTGELPMTDDQKKAFIDFIREEQKFSTVEALVRQMDDDSTGARAALTAAPDAFPKLGTVG